MGSTIETLHNTVSQMTDDQIDICGGNNNGVNNNRGCNNKIGVNNNGRKIRRMEMVVEIIYLIAATLAAVREDVDLFLI